jgi:hypothetical protein
VDLKRHQKLSVFLMDWVRMLPERDFSERPLESLMVVGGLLAVSSEVRHPQTFASSPRQSLALRPWLQRASAAEHHLHLLHLQRLLRRLAVSCLDCLLLILLLVWPLESLAAEQQSPEPLENLAAEETTQRSGTLA